MPTILDIITKSGKTFLYAFGSSYTVLNFDDQKVLESLSIAIISALLVIFDVLSRKKI